LLLPLLASGAFAAYRVLERDYRYHELVRLEMTSSRTTRARRGLPELRRRVGLKPNEPLAYVKRADAERRQKPRARPGGRRDGGALR
jgi:hypothetical protein